MSIRATQFTIHTEKHLDRVARKIQKEHAEKGEDLVWTAALEKASVKGGYRNYEHARQTLQAERDQRPSTKGEVKKSETRPPKKTENEELRWKHFLKDSAPETKAALLCGYLVRGLTPEIQKTGEIPWLGGFLVTYVTKKEQGLNIIINDVTGVKYVAHFKGDGSLCGVYPCLTKAPFNLGWYLSEPEVYPENDEGYYFAAAAPTEEGQMPEITLAHAFFSRESGECQVRLVEFSGQNASGETVYGASYAALSDERKARVRALGLTSKKNFDALSEMIQDAQIQRILARSPEGEAKRITMEAMILTGGLWSVTGHRETDPELVARGAFRRTVTVETEGGGSGGNVPISPEEEKEFQKALEDAGGQMDLVRAVVHSKGVGRPITIIAFRAATSRA